MDANDGPGLFAQSEDQVGRVTLGARGSCFCTRLSRSADP